MASLTGALAIATRALLNDNAGIDITSNNIANANTEGYSRQRPVFEETAPIQYGNLEFGNGANLQQVESVRDKLLEIRIQQETQQQADSGAYLGAMQQVQSLIGNAQGGPLETAINGFFDSLTQLTSDPSNPSIRQNVLTAGQNVAAEFNRLSTNLNQTRAQLDQQVSGATDSVNQLTSQIAALNPQIALLQASGQNAGTLEDQRTQLINQLSQLIDVNTVQSDNGFTLTTAGAPHWLWEIRVSNSPRSAIPPRPCCTFTAVRELTSPAVFKPDSCTDSYRLATAAFLPISRSSTILPEALATL
jgi:flagellar hook-associated protein 1